jgi:hypothetical protein
MRAHKTAWLALLAVVAATVILVSVISLGPILNGKLSPQAALAEELPPEETSIDIQATGSLHTLSIPTAAFSPEYPGIAYLNVGSSLSLGIGDGSFVAPVYLPQGAKAVRLVAFAFDNNSAYSVSVYLYRAVQNQSFGQLMAQVSTANSAYVQKLVDTTITHPSVNNDSYSYYAVVRIVGPSVTLSTVKIIYYY